MADPQYFDCPADEWTKVATNVTKGTVLIRDNNETSANEQPRFLQLSLDSPGTPPADGDPDKGVELLYPGQEVKASVGKDVFVYPEMYPGKIRFDP